MNGNETRLNEIEEELAGLPEGSISYKTIRGAKRMYFQGKYVKSVDEAGVIMKVSRRKHLEAERDILLTGINNSAVEIVDDDFETNVLLGEALARATSGVLKYGYRECAALLKDYLESDAFGKVCLIYGLRRTGKTTMVLQEISNLPISKTAYIKIIAGNTMAQLNQDMKKLSKCGYKYVFIDEVTLMKDFIDSASLLSDVYAIQGMKIVLSGTDSLGLAISSHEELYDRTVTIHTTFISFREYSNLLNIHDVDEYIRYGGTFRMGETAFGDAEASDESLSFRDDESARRYIDTAIAKNIQHSLACYKEGGHFRHLMGLYEADELTGAVNRIIEDMNHRFLLSVLTREFVSHEVTNNLMRILEIKNSSQRRVTLTDDHVQEIKEYLRLLDLIVDCPIEGINTSTPVENIIFSQPGMRYCQAQALVYSLMQDEVFSSYSAIERKEICELILEEVRGRMLEEMVLLETIKTLPRNKKAFKLMFEVGEVDMVICDTDKLVCELYEIKHSMQVDARQYKYIDDEDKCRLIEHKYGTIEKRVVLYRGDDEQVGNIEYRNVAAYLEGLKRLMRSNEHK